MEFTHEEASIADTKPLPNLCELKKAASGEMLGWDAPCVKSFLLFESAAIGNTEIAVHNTSALRKTEAAADNLVNAGKLQREVAIIRQELLAESRAAHTRDKWFYRIVITLGLIGVAVQ